MKKIFLSLALFALTTPLAFSADGDKTTVTFNWNPGSGSGLRFLDSGGTMLSVGTTPTPGAFGNGDVIQLGYYASATTTGSGNFGTTIDGSDWVALTGDTSLNSAFEQLSTGDRNLSGVNSFQGGGNAGSINVTLTFIEASTSAGLYPSLVGIPLAIRFYDNSTIGSSTYYNVVSSDSWTWVAPTTVGSTMTVSYNPTLPLEWPTGSTAFRTSLLNPAAIPEPSTYAFLGMGLLGLVAYRRK